MTETEPRNGELQFFAQTEKTNQKNCLEDTIYRVVMDNEGMLEDEKSSERARSRTTIPPWSISAQRALEQPQEDFLLPLMVDEVLAQPGNQTPKRESLFPVEPAIFLMPPNHLATPSKDRAIANNIATATNNSAIPWLSDSDFKSQIGGLGFVGAQPDDNVIEFAWEDFHFNEATQDFAAASSISIYMEAYPGTSVQVNTDVVVSAFYSDTGFPVEALTFTVSGPDGYQDESPGDGISFGTPSPGV